MLTKYCGPFRCVLCYELPGGVVVRDPALADDMDPKAYAASMFDPSLVKVKPGQTPTWMTLRCPPRKQRDAAPEGAGERADWYTRCGVRKLEGFYRVEEDGTRSEVVVELQPEGELGTVATPKLITDMDLDDFARYAVFGMIRDLTQVAAGPLAKPSGRPAGPTE